MIRRFVGLLIPFAVACAAESDDACERAAAHVAACFPDHAAVTTCDPATADAIADLPCEEIAAWDGKADNPYCAWTPWLCTGSSTSGRKLEVAVEECGPGALCPYVMSAACGLVTLHDDDDRQVARGFTNMNGRLTFEGVAPGEYTVKVRKRDNRILEKTTVEVGGGETPWARLYLPPGSEAAITQCADVRGNVTFTDASGARLDRRDAEWSWLVELDIDGATQLTRPLFVYPDSNIVAFQLVPRGTHTLRYIRMDIPSYEQKPNPDYARLLRLYATDEEAIEQTITVSSTQFGKTLDVTRKIIDPLAP